VSDATTIPVIDFRRQRMVLHWHSLSGTWTACDMPPERVHGIAMIRPNAPNVCVYGHEGRLRLQVGPQQYDLSEDSPRISCTRGIASLGFRRRFTLRSGTGGVLFNHAYWTNHGRDFYRWLADKAQDADWRVSCAQQWSDGVASAELRPS
jgi:hypothetical protein